MHLASCMRAIPEHIMCLGNYVLPRTRSEATALKQEICGPGVVRVMIECASLGEEQVCMVQGSLKARCLLTPTG